jgi:hypothetical protein
MASNNRQRGAAADEFGAVTRGNGVELGDGLRLKGVELLRLLLTARLLGGVDDRAVLGLHGAHQHSANTQWLYRT